ncbi:hypothetical protein LEL_06173 [Akanthomyces lecanii RCEF 1005]|uniref:Uncharacterized protein n=1 Tax=Akanthomyces lecanii RCEF 1005 TaxID=1081108 RepID=A0A168GH99_CORDF|nr:hypothetical protein LEL_06173 [Akanthomyces lecanii RCEF 1005]
MSYMVLDCLLKQFPRDERCRRRTRPRTHILQMLSPRPCDTALVALRRPLFALLLSCAIPSTTCPPAFPLPPQARGCFLYTVPRSFGYHGWRAGVVSVLQHAVTLCAAANSACRTCQLCIWTVHTIVPTKIYVLALWQATVGLLHLVGWVAPRLSLRSRTPRQQSGQWAKWKKILGSDLMPWAFAEKLRAESRDGPAPFFPLMTMALLYGTTVLSSLAVVSAVDAVRVVAWYGLSAIPGKGVVYFECAGIQAVTSAGLSTAQRQPQPQPPEQQMNGNAGPWAVGCCAAEKYICDPNI